MALNLVMYLLVMEDSVHPESPTLAFSSFAYSDSPVFGPWKV